jgi:hypothetical protein
VIVVVVLGPCRRVALGRRRRRRLGVLLRGPGLFRTGVRQISINQTNRGPLQQRYDIECCIGALLYGGVVVMMIRILVHILLGTNTLASKNGMNQSRGGDVTHVFQSLDQRASIPTIPTKQGGYNGVSFDGPIVLVGRKDSPTTKGGKVIVGRSLFGTG